MVSEEMKKDGPGIWFVLHILGIWADNPEKKRIYCLIVRFIIFYLRCKTCREHAEQYLKDHPPENAPSPFVWSWEFHNYANKNSGKPDMSYADAKDLYINGKIKNCNNDC